jgi:hypothetical protein
VGIAVLTLHDDLSPNTFKKFPKEGFSPIDAINEVSRAQSRYFLLIFGTGFKGESKRTLLAISEEIRLLGEHENFDMLEGLAMAPGGLTSVC